MWKVYNIHSGKIVKANLNSEDIAKEWLDARESFAQEDYIVEEMDDDEEEEFLNREEDEEDVVSHNENSIKSTPIESAEQILLYANDVDVIGIDEAQFFDNRLGDVCNELANNGIRVIVAGLDMDFQGKPFGPIPHLMAIAEYTTKVHAICISCGNLAQYSHRTIKGDDLVVLGETESYEPLCRKCYNEAHNDK